MTAAPQSEEAEIGVLGAMLESSKSVEAALDVLEPNGEQKFYKPSHGRVYATIRSLWSNGKPVDAVIVGDVLGQDMVPVLASMLVMAAVPNSVPAQARIIREMWVRREAMATLTRALHEVESGDPLAVVDSSMAEIERLAGGREQDESSTIGDLLHGLVQELQDDEPRESFPAPVKCLPRLYPGRVYVFGGYTGHGKSSLGFQWAWHLAENGVPVTVHSLEMSKEDVRDRLVAQQGVPLVQLQQRPEKRFWDRLLEVGSKAEGFPLAVVDSSTVRAADVLRTQRRVKSRVIFFDHIHQMEVSGKYGDHRLALNRELRQFVNIAKSENVAIVLLAQLNRPQSLSESLPRPTLRSLKETGALEENAAYVGFVWRKVDDDGVPTGYAEWITGKDRFGAVPAPQVMEFDGARQVFRSGFPST